MSSEHPLRRVHQKKGSLAPASRAEHAAGMGVAQLVTSGRRADYVLGLAVVACCALGFMSFGLASGSAVALAAFAVLRARDRDRTSRALAWGSLAFSIVAGVGVAWFWAWTAWQQYYACQGNYGCRPPSTGDMVGIPIVGLIVALGVLASAVAMARWRTGYRELRP